jgi:hypothetical protein
LPAVSVPVPLVREKKAEGGGGGDDAASSSSSVAAGIAGERDVRTVGLQILGQFGQDEMVLQAAEMLEGLVASRQR